MKNHDKNIKSLYLMYLDANNLYGWTISQNIPVNAFKWKKNTFKFNEDFTKNYNEYSKKRQILEIDIADLKRLHNLHNDLAFLPGKMNIKKYNKLACRLYDKNKYVAHIMTSKSIKLWISLKESSQSNSI